MPTRTVWAMGASLVMGAALCASDARAQFYLGGEGGWTGLEGQRSTIAGFPINQSFDGGFNVGARAGYQMGPWRFEGEYSYRQNASINGNLNAPAFGYRSKTSDVVFAYQAIAGVRYMINPVLAFDLDYRYRGTADATYQARAFTVGGVTVPATKYSGSANTNNVVASLTYLFGAAPPPPYAPPPMPPAPPPQAARVFMVFFDWDRDTITPEGATIIHQAADAFRSGAPVQIQVTGYTDRSGSPAYNQRLSERRANNVANALSHQGVPRNQMSVSGRGENDNRVPTADGVRDPQNRRVEITAS